MKLIRLFFRYEALGLSRSRLFQILLGLLLLAGVYAIFYGKAQMQRQQVVLKEIRADQARKMAALKAKITTDTLPNVIGNRTFRLVENPPSDWASLSIGQRDIFPYYLYVRYWSLSRQILTTEIANPEKLLTGNFDLAFVLVYIFPLFIIALSFNLISGEREGGTLSVLLSNPVSERWITLVKIAFRWLVCMGIALGLLLLAILICQLPLDVTLFWWLLTMGLYFAFWFGIVLVINNLKQNSSFNAFSLLGIWIVIVVIIPALINLYLASAYASPPRNDLTQSIRHEFEQIWDKYDDKKHRYQTARRLAAKYPSYASDTSSNWEDKYMLAEYDFYDQRLAPLFAKYQTINQQREQIGGALSSVSAAALTQRIFNGLAQTDASNFYHFQQQVARFHTELKTYFYTSVYQNRPFKRTDFDKIPTYRVQSNTQGNVPATQILILFASVLVVWTTGIWKK